MLDFKLSDEQELLLESADQFMNTCGFDDIYFMDCYEENRVPEEYFKALKDSPFGTLGLPEEFGGTPVDQVTMALVKERFYSRNFPFDTPVLQIEDVKTWGTKEQLEMVTEALKTHSMAFCLGITEPQAGSDDSAIMSTFTRKDGKIYLNGHKCFITNAAYAPYILFVTRDLENPKPHTAMTMWLVDMHKPGITLEPMHKIGNKMDPIADVYFDNVEVEESDMFGKENNGFIQLVKNFELERISLATQSLGQAEYCYNTSLAYAVQREQFGTVISNFELVQDLIVKMRIAVDNMRYQVLHAAWMKDQGMSTQIESGLAKLYCAQAAFEVADMAMQVMGGIGYTEDCAISRVWADARMNRIGGGTDQIVINSTGKAIGKAEHKRQGNR
ncbi:MAG: acyl-CoA dehydrogenase family protein [Eggerthellaceae bacterium]|nr:acyl-CoA dehydrogenase family protein [Eggerthellaceae bacterium]